MVKHVMHYLAGTTNLAICYSCDLFDEKDPVTQVPMGHCNADWGNNEIDRQSVTGVAFLFCGGAIIDTSSGSYPSRMNHYDIIFVT